jgi:hypothetical protein
MILNKIYKIKPILSICTLSNLKSNKVYHIPKRTLFTLCNNNLFKSKTILCKSTFVKRGFDKKMLQNVPTE